MRDSVRHPVRLLVPGAKLVGLLIIAAACRQQATPPVRQDVTVIGHDYAFQLPESLPAGRTVFHFRNAGKVDHEMFMVPLKPGKKLAQALQIMKAGQKADSVFDRVAGVLLAKPGTDANGGLEVDLLPGRAYAMFCWFTDGPDKPAHYTLGMMSSRTIASTP